MQVLKKYENEPIINATGENREVALERVKKIVLQKFNESKRYPNNIYNLQNNPNPMQPPLTTGINNFVYIFYDIFNDIYIYFFQLFLFLLFLFYL